MRTKNDEFRGIFVAVKVAVKCFIMVVEQKFEVLWKAEK